MTPISWWLRPSSYFSRSTSRIAWITSSGPRSHPRSGISCDLGRTAAYIRSSNTPPHPLDSCTLLPRTRPTADARTWTTCPGIGGPHASESVDDMCRNPHPVSPRIVSQKCTGLLNNVYGHRTKHLVTTRLPLSLTKPRCHSLNGRRPCVQKLIIVATSQCIVVDNVTRKPLANLLLPKRGGIYPLPQVFHR